MFWQHYGKPVSDHNCLTIARSSWDNYEYGFDDASCLPYHKRSFICQSFELIDEKTENCYPHKDVVSELVFINIGNFSDQDEGGNVYNKKFFMPRFFKTSWYDIRGICTWTWCCLFGNKEWVYRDDQLWNYLQTTDMQFFLVEKPCILKTKNGYGLILVKK